MNHDREFIEGPIMLEEKTTTLADLLEEQEQSYALGVRRGMCLCADNLFVKIQQSIYLTPERIEKLNLLCNDQKDEAQRLVSGKWEVEIVKARWWDGRLSPYGDYYTSGMLCSNTKTGWFSNGDEIAIPDRVFGPFPEDEG